MNKNVDMVYLSICVRALSCSWEWLIWSTSCSPSSSMQILIGSLGEYIYIYIYTTSGWGDESVVLVVLYSFFQSCHSRRFFLAMCTTAQASGLTSLFLKSHCHLIDVSTATPRYQSPHYFSTDLVHPWHLPTVETYAVTSAKEMSKQGLSYEYLREGVSSTFWQHFKLVISHSCREHREPPAFQETVCLNL